MTKLLFFGDLAPTGFGTVTMDLGRALLRAGVDVRFVSQNDVDDLEEPFLSRTYQVEESDVDPSLANAEGGIPGLGVGSLSLLETGISGLLDGRLWKDGWEPDTALILGDFGSVRLLVTRNDETRMAFASIPTYHYVPIEGVDLPPRLRELWSVVSPIAMTEFGAGEIEKVTGERPPVILHGVDTDVFRPVSPEKPLRIQGKVVRSKEDAKRAIGAERTAKILLRTDRNMPRKRYPEMFRALAPVLMAHPDAYLIVHCVAADQGGDLEDTLSKYPAKIRSRIIVTDGRVSRDHLVLLYNAADVYVSNSAEGFGLTIAEALACGVPAVGLDYSSVPEVIGPGGRLAEVASLIDNEYGYFWAGVNQKSMAVHVHELLEDESLRRSLGEAGRAHVRECFDWDSSARDLAAIMARRAVEEVPA